MLYAWYNLLQYNDVVVFCSEGKLNGVKSISTSGEHGTVCHQCGFQIM